MNRCYEPDRELKSEDPIICNRCVHKREGVSCDAFPEGIPMYILRNGEHFISVPGDSGIIFEAKR